MELGIPIKPEDLCFVPIPGDELGKDRTVIENQSGRHFATVPGFWSRDEHATVFAALLNTAYHLGLDAGRRGLKKEINLLLRG